MPTQFTILLIILIALTAYNLAIFIQSRRAVKSLTEEEFKAGYRKAQLIDIRQPSDYQGGHILGARNIPINQLRSRIGEIRPDQPIYLYDQRGATCARYGMMLKRKGYGNIFQLKGGFKDWTGTVKKK